MSAIPLPNMVAPNFCIRWMLSGRCQATGQRLAIMRSNVVWGTELKALNVGDELPCRIV